MLEVVVDQLVACIGQVNALYHRLIVLVGPAGSGKTRILRQVHNRTGARLLNVNLELSRQMLELTERQRALQLPRLLADLVGLSGGDLVLLDNTELLFDVALRQDPLRLLQSVARDRTVIAAWSGSASEGRLTYATPGHAEYRRYPLDGLVVVSADTMG